MKRIKEYITKLKFYLEWGVWNSEDIITNEELYNWFYCSDNFDICYKQ